MHSTLFSLLVSRKKSTTENEQVEPILPKILDGKYYAFVEFTERPNLLALCVVCKAQRSAAINGTGNLVKHYKENHPTLHDEILDYISRAPLLDSNIPNKTRKPHEVVL